jgi:hypothetical protein
LKLSQLYGFVKEAEDEKEADRTIFGCFSEEKRKGKALLLWLDIWQEQVLSCLDALLLNLAV